MPKIYIINGPNLNLLGQRETDVYGHATLDDVQQSCEKYSKQLGVTICFLQSNHEGQLVDWIHQARHDGHAIVINPAAYGHTSIAILDALQAFDGLVVEVHLSHIHRRERFRHHSYVAARADGFIAGCGEQGYLYALDFVAKQHKT